MLKGWSVALEANPPGASGWSSGWPGRILATEAVWKESSLRGSGREQGLQCEYYNTVRDLQGGRD